MTKNKRRYDWVNYNFLSTKNINLAIGIEFNRYARGHKTWNLLICGMGIESYLEHEE